MAKKHKKRNLTNKMSREGFQGENLAQSTIKTPHIENTDPLRKHARLSGCALILIVVAAISVCAVTTNRQLEFLGGMAEDYFRLGMNLHKTGRFHRYADDTTYPFTFRPPGYAFFIAGVIKATDIYLKYADDEYEKRSIRVREQTLAPAAIKATGIVQALLHSLSSMVLFLWLSRYLAFANSLIIALIYGCNPYLIIHAGFLHYEILHLTLTIASCYCIDACLQTGRHQAVKLVMAGALWGVTTLVRPQTLFLPAFLPIILTLYFFNEDIGLTIKQQIKSGWRKVCLKTGFIVLGMFLAIFPWTLRNYSVSGKIIPVNTQAWNVVWASTVNVVERAPNHFRWWSTWYPYGMPIFTAVTGSSKYNYRDFITYQYALEDAFKKETIKNLLRRPHIYLQNVILHGASFIIDINSAMIKFYQAIQVPDKAFSKKWLWVGHPQNFHESSAAKKFNIFTSILTFLAFIGMGLGIIRKEKWLIVPIAVFILFWLSHALTYLDIFYYYIKMPFLYIFSAYTITTMKKFSLDKAINYILLIFCIGWLTLPVLW